MIIEFGQGINASAVLGDDLASVQSSRITVDLQSLGGQAATEAVPMADASFQLLLSHLNVTGEFTFTATQTFGSVDDVLAYLFSQYAMIGQQDQLTLIWNGGQWFFAGAILRAVQRVGPPQSNGVRLCVRYTFQIGQASSTLNQL